MKTFPMFLKMEGRRVVILGGGEQAAQKARLILKTEAQLQILAPELDPELQAIIAQGKAQHVDAASPGLFEGTALVFVATGCKGADASWHAIAKSHHALVNVVDYPDLSDAITPSIVDRDPVVVAIGTEGNAPVLGRRLKTKIEQILHPNLGGYAALAGRLRAEVARYLPASDRRPFWHWVFSGDPWSIFSAGNEREAANRIKGSIRSGDFSQTSGRLSIVTGAVGADVVTLGIVERLQAADVIYAEDDVDPSVLELARRDARRVTVERADGLQLHANAALKLALNAATELENVVYLCTDAAVTDMPDPVPVPVDFHACAMRQNSLSRPATATTAQPG